jgi:serine protease Do
MTRSRGTSAQVVALLAVLATFACGKGGGASSSGDPLPSGATSVQPLTTQPVAPVATAPAPARADIVDVKSGPLSFAPIVKNADPSVVTVNVVGREVEVSPFSHRKRAREMKGLGTGFIVEKDGVILTNNHVIAEADQISVKLSDDREFDARIIGRDQQTDIGVLKIEAKDLTPLVLGDSDAIDIGDWVVAIGNPFGLSHTVSAGIISAKGRTREDVPLDPTGYYSFMQTDASINPGNSGGPLLNLHSEVVGINTAIRGGGAQGIGFAIPINMVKQLIPMLMRDGKITRSALGVHIRDVRELTPEDRVALKLSNEKGAPLVTDGAVIEQVDPGGPADRAGLSAGDVITQFEGKPIGHGTELRWLASTFGVGRTATVHVVRDGKQFDAKVTLGQLPDATPESPRMLPPGFGPSP